jgi:outer membrane protein assembly factor BamB
VNRFIAFVLLIFLTNCSLDTKSGIWTKKERITKEKEKNIEQEEKNINNLFEENDILKKELNAKLKINLTSKLFNNSFSNNLNNNAGRLNYDGNLKSISKFKFSKIKNFNLLEPEILSENNNLIFFDNNGTLIKFDTTSKVIWEKNYYNKQEKKSKPILFFNNNKDTLIVADSISKYYAINIQNGDLLWSKENSSPFNSQVKIYKNKFFVIDFDNILRCYSINDGKELWKVKTGNVFIKSQKKLSIVVENNTVYFNNSIGDISAVDIKSGNLLWQTPTQNNSIYQDSFFLKTSDLITNGKSIVFSNNKNEFYSLDAQRGFIKWKQEINSNLTSTLINELIFAITNEGFLVIIDDKTGNIIRVTDVFSTFRKNKKNSSKSSFNNSRFNLLYLFDPQNIPNEKNKKYSPLSVKFKPIGFIVGKKNIYLTTNHGRLFVIDVSTGKTISVIKIDNEKISRPFVINQNLFIIKENSIIKLN